MIIEPQSKTFTVRPFTIIITIFNIWPTPVLVNKRDQYLLFPIGGEDSFGLVISSQPVNTALNQNQTEFSIFILKIKIDRIQENHSKLNIILTVACIDTTYFNEKLPSVP